MVIKLNVLWNKQLVGELQKKKVVRVLLQLFCEKGLTDADFCY